MATQTATTAAAATAKRKFSAEEKNACSFDTMMNGGECEACQFGKGLATPFHIKRGKAAPPRAVPFFANGVKS